MEVPEKQKILQNCSQIKKLWELVHRVFFFLQKLHLKQ